MKKDSLKKNLFQGNKLKIVLILILISWSAFLNVYIAFFIQDAVDVTTSGDMGKLLFVVVRMLIFVLITVILGLINQKVTAAVVKRGMCQYRGAILNAFLDKDVKEFKRGNTGAYISVMGNDLDVVEQNYLRNNFAIFGGVVQLCIALMAAISLNYVLLLILIVLTLVPIIISELFSGKISKKQLEASKQNEVYQSFIKDLFQGYTVIKSFHSEKEMGKISAKENEKLEGARANKICLERMVAVLSSGSALLVQVSCFSVGGYFVMKGKMTVGSVMAFVQLISIILMPVQGLAEQLNKKKAAKEIIRKIDEYTQRENKEGGMEKKSFDGEISFKNVSFLYEETGKQVLRNIHFNIEKGKSYAIVGGSGSGKSTLVKLLLGYYDNYEGEITMDGQDINEIDRGWLYKMISFVQQDVFIFDDTIKNNILMYKNYSGQDLEKVIDASGLGDVIAEKGLDFKCGENGSNLSGGQAQRISIARALITRAAILVMDEATSALDAVTAMELERNIQGLEEITRIVITHSIDKNILEKYDKIVFMKNGEIREMGSFQELMEQGGEFGAFYKLEEIDS